MQVQQVVHKDIGLSDMLPVFCSLVEYEALFMPLSSVMDPTMVIEFISITLAYWSHGGVRILVTI